MPRTRRTPRVPRRQTITHADYKIASAALMSVRAKMKALKAEEAKLKETVQRFIVDMPKNEDGSFTDKLSFPNNSLEVVYSPRRKTVFVDNALDLIEEWELSEHVIQEIPTINEEWVEQAYNNGLITDEQLATITEEKVTYQLSVKEAKE